MNGVLSRNSEADRIHHTGLEALSADDFGQAHTLFNEAFNMLADERSGVDGLIQSAQIARHNGYAYIRQATTEFEVALLNPAHETIMEAVEMTAPLASGVAFVGTTFAPSPYKQSPKRIRREVFNEHGAALSLLSRLVTAANVMRGFDTRGDSEAASHNRTVEQQPYGLAYDVLRMGSNGRFMVEHAMYGARQECLNGQAAHMLPWLGRAARRVAWAAVRDVENSKKAQQAFRKGWRQIKDYDTAREAVLIDP